MSQDILRKDFHEHFNTLMARPTAGLYFQVRVGGGLRRCRLRLDRTTQKWECKRSQTGAREAFVSRLRVQARRVCVCVCLHPQRGDIWSCVTLKGSCCLLE